MPRPSLCLTLAAVAAASLAWGEPPSPPAPATAETRRTLAAELDAYLWKHVLAPRFPRCVDKEHGGFHVGYARDWSPIEDRSRFVVYQARVAWTAATVARLRPEARSEYLPYVRHGVRYLADVMWDREAGGFHTHVDLAGRAVPADSRPVYGQAFAIYGLAAAHAATGDAEPLELAKRAWRVVEDRYRDGSRPRLPQRGGRRLDRRARGAPHDERPHPPPRGLRGAAAVLAGPRAAEEDGGAARLRARPPLRGAGLPLPRPLARRSRRARARLVRPRRGDGLPDDRGRGGPRPRAVVATLRAARMLVDHALARGYDPARGQLFEYGSAYGPPIDRSIQWWAQFEAFHAFQLMDERFGREDARYGTAFTKAWALARDAFADPEHPGVCPQMDERGEVHCDSKSHNWFASYHTARALLFTADRLRGH